MAGAANGCRVRIVMNRNITLSAVIVAAIVGLGLGVTYWSAGVPLTTRAGERKLVLPRFSTLAIAGNIAFDKNCAQCHGVNALGSGKGPPLIHDIYNPGHHNDDSFYRAVRTGTPQHHWNFGDMKPLLRVTRNQVAAILRYIRELQVANGIVWKQHVM